MDEPLKSSFIRDHQRICMDLNSNECGSFYGSSNFAYDYSKLGESDANNNNQTTSNEEVLESNCKSNDMLDLKRQQEKFNILKEVLSSEKKYLNDLKEIVEGYYEEIKKCSSDEFVYHIFANIKDIYEFTKSFYSLLESSTEDEVGIADCFIKKHKVFLRLYSTYCQNYRIAYNTTEKLETENNIAKIIQKIRNRYGHCLKMTTYLQLPVLRITKYHLLLQRYLNLLETNSSAYNQVLEALELMKQVNDCINQEMPDDEQTPSTLGNSVSTINMNNFVKLFGQILKQGNLLLAQTKKIHYVIVFQKLLVIRKADSPSKIMHSISNESLALLPTSAKTRSFTVIDYSQPKDDVMWQFAFKAKSDEEKKSWQSTILSCMLNGYNKKLSERVKSKISNVTVAENQIEQSVAATSHSIVLHQNRSTHDIIKEKIANFRRLAEFRHSLRTESIKDTTTTSSTSLGSSLRHQFEEAFKRRLSNPVSSSSSSSSSQQHASPSRIVTKLLDKTITLGTFTKETLASPMMKFRRQHQLARIGEASNETSPAVRSSVSTPIIQQKSKQPNNSNENNRSSNTNNALRLVRADSFNVLSTVSTSPMSNKEVTSATIHVSSPIELPRNSTLIPVDYLNRSFDHIDDIDDDDGDGGNDRDLKLVQYRKLICEMNRTFVEKYGEQQKSGDNNGLEELKKMEIKEFPSAKTNEAVSTVVEEMTANINDNSKNNNNNNTVTNDRSSKSSINSEEGYYSNHDSSSCSTLVESSSPSTSPPSSSSEILVVPDAVAAAAAAAATVAVVAAAQAAARTSLDDRVACFPSVRPSSAATAPTTPKHVRSRPPNPPPPVPTQHAQPPQIVPMFKLEKISIKKVDFGETIDSAKEADLNHLLKQQHDQDQQKPEQDQERKTTTLTINLKQATPQRQQPHLRINPQPTSRLSTFKSDRDRITTSRSGLIATNSLNFRSSSLRQHQQQPPNSSSSDYDIGRKLLLHSFKVGSSNNESNGSRLRFNRIGDGGECGDNATASRAFNRATSNSSSNLDNLGFVNVKELISKFESKI